MFTLTIETGNAAFEGELLGVELARILGRIAADLSGNVDAEAVEVAKDGASGKVHDCNGNYVGNWTLTA